MADWTELLEWVWKNSSIGPVAPPPGADPLYNRLASIAHKVKAALATQQQPRAQGCPACAYLAEAPKHVDCTANPRLIVCSNTIMPPTRLEFPAEYYDQEPERAQGAGGESS